MAWILSLPPLQVAEEERDGEFPGSIAEGQWLDLDSGLPELTQIWEILMLAASHVNSAWSKCSVAPRMGSLGRYRSISCLVNRPVYCSLSPCPTCIIARSSKFEPRIPWNADCLVLWLVLIQQLYQRRPSRPQEVKGSGEHELIAKYPSRVSP